MQKKIIFMLSHLDNEVSLIYNLHDESQEVCTYIQKVDVDSS